MIFISCVGYVDGVFAWTVECIMIASCLIRVAELAAAVQIEGSSDGLERKKAK
jgi:hypothetical protein